MTGLRTCLRHPRETLRRYYPRVWLLEGQERHSGEALTILYAGHELNRNYLAHVAYGGRCRQRSLGRAWLWSLPRLARRQASPGLIVTETEEDYFERAGGRDDFYIPHWIDGEVDIAGGERSLRVGESLRDDLRKIRKFGLQYEVTGDAARFDHFYTHMYQPYITRVHGDRAALMSRDVMMSRIDNLELLLIRSGDEHIAGEVLRYEGGGVRSWSLGVKDGDPQHVKQGAIAALYYYRMQYLAGKGFDKYHAGATRPFLDDGVLQYKRKWGLRLTRPRPGGWWLRWNPGSSGARAFMRANPFIFRAQGALYAGITAAEAGAQAAGPEKYRIPGLHGVRFIDAGP